MRTLVSGALGFIGSAYCRAFGTGRELIPLARMSSNRFLDRLATTDLIGKVRWVDLARDDLTDHVADAERVVHFAAKTFVDRSISDPSPFIESNVVGSYRLLEAVRKSRTVERVWWQSTDEVYGAILEGSYTEDARLNPSNPYAATKAAADALAQSYFNTYGVRVIIGRAENVYGPFQGREKVIPTFVRAALRRESLPVYGDGKHRRQWIHVDDVVRAVEHLLDVGTPGEVYHVAGAQELENLELAQHVLLALGITDDYHRHVRFVSDHDKRPGHDRRYALDTTKVRATGWTPLVPLDIGLRDVVQWYADRRDWTFG